MLTAECVVMLGRYSTIVVMS